MSSSCLRHLKCTFCKHVQCLRHKDSLFFDKFQMEGAYSSIFVVSSQTRK
ncbi:hypothetical protein HMPREF6485_0494 [Segatella buccae ATCC 33574]|uniref:Uncharacterized protein n=1 Tax=Segatella buccae ATCC 33574 TaxID=873513 RepID=E6K4C1_9BACT|nr:hypothetical protein HMPREF6485_0494 [Segatella buccae ATCC 33574]